MDKLFEFSCKLVKGHEYRFHTLIEDTWDYNTNIVLENWVCGAKLRLAKFDQSRSFIDEHVKLFRKLTKIHIYRSRFLIADT